MKIPLLLAIYLFSVALLSGQESNLSGNQNSEKFREFDFWTGEWDVNLRQKQRDHSWKDWKKSKAKIYKILDGRAILELWEEQGDLAPASTIIGYSLRYYDQTLQKWVLWLNWPGVNRSGSSSLSGEFRHGRGEFFSERTLRDSTSIISRYTFSDITAQSLRWDDAFSHDGGQTWTHNWVMEFSRTDQQQQLPIEDVLHTFRKGERCTSDSFQKLQNFVGEWSGMVEMNSEEKEQKIIRIKNYKALGNCAVLSFMEIESEEKTSFKEFGLLTYNTFANKFEDGRLSNDYSSNYRAFYGDYSNENKLQLDRQDQDGRMVESFTWTFNAANFLAFEKWGYEGEKKVLVLSGRLERVSR